MYLSVVATSSTVLSPRHPIGLLNMGQVHLLRGDAQKCIGTIRTLLSVDPLNAHGAYLLALAYAKSGKTLRALNTLDALVSADPSYRARLRDEPGLSSLRGLKRFQGLCAP